MRKGGWALAGSALIVILVFGVGLAAQDDATEADVREALQQYAVALESLNVAEVERIQPSIDSANLERAFRDMEALEVGIDDVEFLSLDEASARISCRVTQTLTPRAGSEQSTNVVRVLRLRKEADSWVIDSFER